MTYFTDVFLSLLPYLRVALFAAVVWGLSYYGVKRFLYEKLNDTGKRVVDVSKKSIVYALGFYLAIGLTASLIDPQNTPKNTVFDRASAAQGYANAVKEPGDLRPIEDRTRQNKQTDEERAKSFEEMVKIKKD